MKINILNLFKKMLRIRMVEEKISNEYKFEQIRCPVHFSIGQESIAVSICENLKKKDQIVTAHRSHAHYLAKGGNLKKMIAELYGKDNGSVRGLGGSMHLLDLDKNILAAVPIVGSTIAIGVGLAWANKLDGNKNITTIFFGDGATEEGIFLESLDFASLHNLKILFVCENNKYSVNTHINQRQYSKRNLCKLANSLGLNSLKFNDHDLISIYIKTRTILKNIKKFSRPFLIDIDTYRFLEHCGPNNEDFLNYRNPNELRRWKKNCQIEKYKKILFKKKTIKFETLKIKISHEIDNAFKYAQKGLKPKKSILKKLIIKN
jgi:pyruvate dehydrogenase E1 component alpha subunit